MNWILLTIILLVICWFEVFGVLGIGKGAAKGWIAVSVVGEASLTSCVDDLPSINSRIGYFLVVVTTAMVLTTIWLVPWSLIACRSFDPRALGAGDLLLFLGSLLLLLRAAVAAWSVAGLRGCRRCSP